MAIYKNKWIVSYETLLFDTVDSDLDVGQYALDGEGTGYYIRTVPKDEGQFIHIDLTLRDMAENTYSLVGKKLVNIIPGHAYYDEFLTAIGATALWGVEKAKDLPVGGKIRIKSSAEKYNPLRYVKDATQPSRMEVVTILPPEEPKGKAATHHSISFDATSNCARWDSLSSYSFSHTCGATADLLVFGEAHASDVYRTVDAVTYNAVGMAFVRRDGSTSAYYGNTTIYYLLAPDTGSALSVAVTLSGTALAGIGGVVSYSGAKQSGQPDAHNGAIGTGTTASVIVTTVADNCWVFSVPFHWKTLTCGNTQRWLYVGDWSAGESDTGAPKTPAGAQTMSWTTAISGTWAISAASFAPSTGWTNIASLKGVAAASIASVNSVPVASIASISGVAV